MWYKIPTTLLIVAVTAALVAGREEDRFHKLRAERADCEILMVRSEPQPLSDQ